jgi:sugar fermentation stimulation protein A
MTELILPHRFPGPPLEATLRERSNRFLAHCVLADGSEVQAHVPDRGRLLTVLVPGARVWLYRAGANGTRRTEWSLLVAEEPASKVLVAIDPAAANARARPLIERGLIPALGGGWEIRPETTFGDSRLDFLLTRGTDRVAVEVKNVGVVTKGIALFPDAPTSRGVKHLAELERFVDAGHRALLLFVAQRADAMAVSPDVVIDPAFTHALKAAHAKVELAAVRFEIRPEACLFRGEIPVILPSA